MGKYSRYGCLCGVIVLGLLAGCRSSKCCTNCSSGCGTSCGSGCGTAATTTALTPTANPSSYAGTPGVPGGAVSQYYNQTPSSAVMGQPPTAMQQQGVMNPSVPGGFSGR